MRTDLIIQMAEWYEMRADTGQGIEGWGHFNCVCGALRAIKGGGEMFYEPEQIAGVLGIPTDHAGVMFASREAPFYNPMETNVQRAERAARMLRDYVASKRNSVN